MVMTTRLITSMAFGLCLTLSAPASHAQNLLINGSFEWPALAPSAPSFPALYAGTTNLPGWSVGSTGSLYLVLPSRGLTPLEGRQYVDFNGRPHSVSLSQSFATTTGDVYEVTFTLGRYQAPDTERVTAEITDGSGTVLAGLQAVAPFSVGWGTPSRFRFTATGPISTLQFRTTNGGVNVELCMDAVSVERMTPRLSIEILETSHARVCWESLPGWSYQLQYCSALTTNVWTDLGNPKAGLGAMDCAVQLVSGPQRFYRIVRLP